MCPYNSSDLTQKNGSIKKVEEHGLQQFPTSRCLLTAKLKTVNGGWLVYAATVGGPRNDGRTNRHRMYKLLKNGKPPYFRNNPGPWQSTSFDTSCVVSADFNNDSFDDLIVCQDNGNARLYVQNSAGTFTPTEVEGSNWRNARVDYVTNRERPDLVVVEGRKNDPAYYMRIFCGQDEPPYFDLTAPCFTFELPHAAADLEIADVNDDGYKDIYVLQSDERTGYCAVVGKTLNDYWPGVRPPIEWVPPLNVVPDLLFVGSGTPDGGVSFTKVEIERRGNGCGGLLRKFGNDQTLIVARGRILHYGFNYLYSWPQPARRQTRKKLFHRQKNKKSFS